MQLATHFRELVDAFSELIAQHIKLAKVELKEDARAIAAQVGKIAAYLPLVLVGYLLLMVAAALYLHRFIQADLAFLCVALVNLLGGGLGIVLAVRKLQARQVMDDTSAELKTTAIVLRGERL